MSDRKRARKIKEKPLTNPLKKKRKVEVNIPKKVRLHWRNRLARKTRELNETKVKITVDDIVITKTFFLSLCATNLHKK